MKTRDRDLVRRRGQHPARSNKGLESEDDRQCDAHHSSGRLRVDVNNRLILRRPRTLEGIALAEATAHYAEAEQRPAAFKRALEESWSTIGAAQRTVKKAEASVEEAKANAASRLAASMIVSAVAAPVSVKQTRVAPGTPLLGISSFVRVINWASRCLLWSWLRRT